LLVAIMAFVVMETMVFTVGALYLGSGREAVRGQVPRLAVLAGALWSSLSSPFPVLNTILGDSASGVVFPRTSAAVATALIYQSRRGQGAFDIERGGAALRLPAFRGLLLIWVAAIAIATVLVALAAKAATDLLADCPSRATRVVTLKNG